jgi:hypothetical protein
MNFKVSRLRRAVRPRRAAFFCLAFVFTSAFAHTANLPFDVRIISWSAAMTNDDGSPLTDLAGYYVYTGNSPDTLVARYFSAPGQLGMILYYPPGGVHYFGVTAVNVEGVESAMTPAVGK